MTGLDTPAKGSMIVWGAGLLSYVPPAAGSQLGYGEIVALLATNATDPVQWDSEAESPYFFFRDTDGSTATMRYDDPKSIAIRMQAAQSLGLRGVGMWNVD